jgi:hypothetical protein
VPVQDLAGHDEEETLRLQKMSLKAHRYLESQSWCVCTLESCFGGGIGDVFAIFLFRIVPAHDDIDDWIWVAVGDVPSAYLPLEDAAAPGEMFHQYVEGMTRWVDFARSGETEIPADVPPINVPPTPQWADNLERRIRSLKEIVGPWFT